MSFLFFSLCLVYIFEHIHNKNTEWQIYFFLLLKFLVSEIPNLTRYSFTCSTLRWTLMSTVRTKWKKSIDSCEMSCLTRDGGGCPDARQGPGVTIQAMQVGSEEL